MLMPTSIVGWAAAAPMRFKFAATPHALQTRTTPPALTAWPTQLVKLEQFTVSSLLVHCY